MNHKLTIIHLGITGGSLVIEVSKTSDRNHTVLREIYVDKPLDDRKSFEQEISFWFMENGSSL